MSNFNAVEYEQALIERQQIKEDYELNKQRIELERQKQDYDLLMIREEYNREYTQNMVGVVFGVVGLGVSAGVAAASGGLGGGMLLGSTLSSGKTIQEMMMSNTNFNVKMANLEQNEKHMMYMRAIEKKKLVE